MPSPATVPAWAALIRDVPDFPRPGVVFRDIAPLLGDAEGFAAMLHALAEPWRGTGVAAVAGIESRGFILGAALARELGAGFVPLRKPGKLPGPTLAVEYALEYGHDRLEIHADALPPGANVLVVDDVLATGGTLRAGVALVRRQGARVCAAEVLVELSPLGGRAGWDDPAPLRAVLAV